MPNPATLTRTQVRAVVIVSSATAFVVGLGIGALIAHLFGFAS